MPYFRRNDIQVPRPRKVKNVKFFLTPCVDILENKINDFVNDNPHVKMLGVRVSQIEVEDNEGYHPEFLATVTYLTNADGDDYDTDEERDSD